MVPINIVGAVTRYVDPAQGKSSLRSLVAALDLHIVEKVGTHVALLSLKV